MRALQVDVILPILGVRQGVVVVLQGIEGRAARPRIQEVATLEVVIRRHSAQGDRALCVLGHVLLHGLVLYFLLPDLLEEHVLELQKCSWVCT